jgi:hypothetical protein
LPSDVEAAVCRLSQMEPTDRQALSFDAIPPDPRGADPMTVPPPWTRARGGTQIGHI